MNVTLNIFNVIFRIQTAYTPRRGVYDIAKVYHYGVSNEISSSGRNHVDHVFITMNVTF